MKKMIPLKVHTTKEIEQYIFDTYSIDPYFVGMRFSPTRMGTMNRKYIEGTIDPSIEEIYVHLYLKKHPPITVQ